MREALKVFDEFSPDVLLWTSMVTGYERNGNAVEALEFLSRMVAVGHVSTERVTLVSACAQLSYVKTWKMRFMGLLLGMGF